MSEISWNSIVCGDALDVLKTIPAESVQLVLTSPPYFQQRDYCGIGIGNESSLEEYLTNLLKIFDECLRVVKQSGHLVFNLGDKYASGSLSLIPYRFAIRVLDAHPSLRLINDLTWVKTNPVPKQDRRKLICATEPFFIFAKSADYVFNPDHFLASEDQVLKPNQESQVGQSYFGLIEKSDLTKEEKENAVYKLHAAIEEVKNGEIAGFRMKIRGIHAEAYGGQSGGRQIQQQSNGFTIIKLFGKSMKKDVIQHAVATIKGNKHPAVFPQPIIEEIIKLLSHEDDVALDPFIGSGTTATAALNTKRQYLGIEISDEYCEIASKRIDCNHYLIK